MNSLRSVERAVRSEIERQAAVLDAGGRVIQETRHFHEDSGVTTLRPGEGRGAGLPLLPRARPGADRPAAGVGRRDSGDAARAAVGAPRPAARGLVVVRPGIRGAAQRRRARRSSRRPSPPARPPADARKWWLGELARRANDAGVERAELPITPAAGGPGGRAGRRRVAERPSSPARSSTACWTARARPTRWSPLAASRSSATTGALLAADRRGDRGEPGRRRQGSATARCRPSAPGRRGHEGHPRQGRRRPRPRVDHGAPGLLIQDECPIQLAIGSCRGHSSQPLADERLEGA